MQTGTTALLELPTGGLADAIGRRRVLLFATVLNIASLWLLLAAHGLRPMLVAFALQGAFRALQSGPLDAWYVDAAHAVDPDAEIERGINASGIAVGFALGGGAAVAGIALALGAELHVPLVLAIVAAAIDLVLIAVLVVEVQSARGMAAFVAAARLTPVVIRMGIQLATKRPQIRALVIIEVLWSTGLIAFETYWQPHFANLTGTDEHPIFAVAAVAMFAAHSAGAAAVPWLTRRLGDAARVGLAFKLVQALALVLLAFAGGLVAATLMVALMYVAHGVSNPVHQSLLHRNAESAVRATVVSVNSLGAQLGALFALPMGLLVASRGIPSTWLISAVILAAAAPMYLLARPAPTEALTVR